MAKKLIVCCDGTGNEIKENQSNVLKFFRALKKEKSQCTYYSPGVGTIGDSGAWNVVKSRTRGVFGLATGFGMDAHVLDAYRFLIRNHQIRDEIYLFGFSRGAHTVRLLAALLNMIGVLPAAQENLADYALTAYKRSSQNDDYSIAWRFQEVMETRRVTIRFMGCWDTVGSVIVPRPDRFYIPSLERNLAFMHSNPSVQVFRHAIAIDERRRMFRLSHWNEPQIFKSNPFMKDEDAIEQDIKQVWFAGVHADIGGGYPEAESGAAKFPLAWMVEEARSHGLQFRERLVDRLVLGKNPANSTRNYVAPCAKAKLHDSMTRAWKILEYLPKRATLREWASRRTLAGFYIPKAEPRMLPPKAVVDPSVVARQKTELGYRPDNLASSFEVDGELKSD